MSHITIVDLLETVWREIDRLGSSFSDAEWMLPTGLSLWTVKDIVAHLVATESILLDQPRPDHVPPNVGTLPNRIAELNEVGVDYRRPWPPQRVLNEFREVTAARLLSLRAMTTEAFARDSWTPAGRGTYLDLMQTRVYDTWIHQLDLSDATGRSMPLTGPLAEHALAMTRQFLRRGFKRGHVLSGGQSVRFDVVGDPNGSFAYRNAGAELCEGELMGDSPSVVVRLPVAAFVRITAGRPVPPEDAGGVTIRGDRALGERVVERLNVLF